MDEWQSAFLLEKIKYYRVNNSIRQKNAKFILQNYDCGIEYTENCVFHQLAIICSNRGKTAERLAANRIPTMIHYPKMLVDMPHFQEKIVFSTTNFRVSDNIISLPVGPHLTTNEMTRICKVIREIQQ